MWFEKNSSIKDYIRYFSKCKGIRVGFCTDISIKKSFLKPYFIKYNANWGSTRLRVNDIIYYSLYSNQINLSFFNPFMKYDILIFQRIFSKKAYLIASKYKRMGTKIILDINVNYFDKTSEIIEKQQSDDIINFLNLTDLIITTSDYLKNYIEHNKFFSKVLVIPEIISDDFFKVQKVHREKEIINLIYVGYAIKALELHLIKDELEELNKAYKIILITICEKPPRLNIKINKKYVRYDQYLLPLEIAKGDIFLAPRDINEPYNLGHSFTKIGYPMSVGLPVLASPVPSYLKSPTIINNDYDSWYYEIEKLINDYQLRNTLGNQGRIYCKLNYSKDIIMKKYIDICKNLIS